MLKPVSVELDKMITLPCFIKGQIEELERLMFEFGKARRRAYSMKQKGIERLEIIRTLRRETGLHTRYIWTAYELIKNLPPHGTFGGLELQRLRERGRISREEYRRRRNDLLACLGQACFKGNLCLRVEQNRLKVTVAPRRWIHLPIRFPERYERYRKFLDGSRPYTVLIKRRSDDKGYDVRITIETDKPKIPEPRRVMALDLNAGHIDFAVVERSNLKPVAFGKVNCHELLSCRKGKNRFISHRTVNKIGNIASHYGAEVVAGKLRTLAVKGRKRSNRKVHRMSQFRLRQVMRYKLLQRGIKFEERSEAGTTKVGAGFSKLIGLDVHKASAYAFALKVIDYQTFMFLHGVCTNEGDGSPSARLSARSGLTALHQLGLVHDEARAEATPQFMGWGGDSKSFLIPILQVKG